jgi:hypothetical protein
MVLEFPPALLIDLTSKYRNFLRCTKHPYPQIMPQTLNVIHNQKEFDQWDSCLARARQV